VMALLTWGVRRVFRFRRPLRVSSARREELLALSRWIDRRTLVPVLMLLIGGPVLATACLNWAEELWHAQLPDTRYLLDPVPPRATWLKHVLPTGMVWGFCLVWWLSTVLVRRVYGRWTTARYIVAGKLKFGLDYTRAARWCLALLAVACVPLTV